jgi:hypothetical protein
MQPDWNVEDWVARLNRAQLAPPPAPVATGSARRILRILALVGLWLVSLIWPTPQLGALLSSQGPRLMNTASQSVSHLVNGGLGGLSATATTGTTTAASGAQHPYWQVGLAADGVPDHLTGVRATIQTRLPEQPSFRTTNYYWVGAYLNDGSFIQAGYYVPWYSGSSAGWFYCAFDASGHEGPCQYGALGTVGGNNSLHVYTLQTAGAATAGATTWDVLVDDQQVGSFTWTAGDTGTNAPVIYAESSGFAAHDPSSVLGPVHFPDGIEVRAPGQASYAPAPHLRVVYNATNVCPPYGIASDGQGGVWLGSGLACPQRWSLLW